MSAEPETPSTPDEPLLGTAASPPPLVFADPWVLLAHARTVDMDDRPGLAAAYLRLAAKRKPLERDSLLFAGKELFGYSIATAREMVKQAADVEAGTGKIAPAVVTDEFLAEMVHRPGHEKPFGYLVHRFDRPDDVPEFVESIETPLTKYMPPRSGMVEAGVVLLPATVEEYGDDSALHRDLVEYITRYMCLPPDQKDVVDLWAAFVRVSWMIDRFDAVPYLRALGDWGTGKSRFLRVIGSVCQRAIFAGGATTPSPMFRAIERFRGTLVLDETDFGRGDKWADILKILNCGYERGVPVLRSEREGDGEFDVRCYDVFGTKVIATREVFRDRALESRCLTYPTEVINDIGGRPLIFDAEARAHAAQLRNKLLWWRLRHYASVKIDPRERPTGTELRIDQIVLPLLAVSDPEVRPILLTAGQHLGLRAREDRREGEYAQLLDALDRRVVSAQAAGYWTVAELQRDLASSLGDRRPPDLRAIGAQLRSLGFIKASTRKDLPASYRFDPRRLAQRRRQYGLDPTRTPLR